MSEPRDNLEDAIREYAYDYAYGRPADNSAWREVLVRIGEYGEFQRQRGYDEGASDE